MWQSTDASHSHFPLVRLDLIQGYGRKDVQQVGQVLDPQDDAEGRVIQHFSEGRVHMLLRMTRGGLVPSTYAAMRDESMEVAIKYLQVRLGMQIKSWSGSTCILVLASSFFVVPGLSRVCSHP